MSVTSQERQELDDKYTKKVVDEAIDFISPVEKKLPDKYNKEDLRLLIEVLQ